ncbi:MAG TPA: glycosyltransferase family 4 protein [Bryobacteraceae bacterium]|jgi:glycosyltransferase involved in cell wall biosynthesis|nr:glycosyltransferase family 4 protein [Bryobacteraceae bacterium]
MFTKPTTPMKVLHVVGDSRFGGVAWIILGLGRVLQAEGWRVDVLTVDPIFQAEVLRQGLGLVDLDVIRREIRPFWDLGGLIRLRNFLRRANYRIVHTHTSKGGFVGRLAARLASVPVIVHTAHGFAFHEASPRSTRLFYSTLERMASRWCDRIVCVSEFHHRWALELGMCHPSRILAIPNGIADIASQTRIPASETRRLLGAQPSDLLILSTSRLAGDKGLEYLIEAAAMIRPGARAVKVAITGDGPVRPRLEDQAQRLGVTDRVMFLGFRHDIGDLLAACDLVVIPSLREGLSMALLEAMAAGKPIIASAIGSHRELAAQAEMARLVPPANSRALYEAIQKLLGDPALMTRLGATARALFESRYTEGRMLNAYRDLYLELLQGKQPGKLPRAQRPQRVSPSLANQESIYRVYAGEVQPPRQPEGGGL